MTWSTVPIGEPGYPASLANPTRRKMLRLYGPGAHPCLWCAKLVRWDIAYPARDALVVDHIDENRNNNHQSNLAISCQSCNSARTVSRLHKEGRYDLSHLYVRYRTIHKRLVECGKSTTKMRVWLAMLDTPDARKLLKEYLPDDGLTDAERDLQHDAWWATLRRNQRERSPFRSEPSAVADPLDSGALEAD